MKNLVKIAMLCLVAVLIMSSTSSGIIRWISDIEFSESLLDIDNDGLAEFLEIDLDFTVTWPGGYYVYADLYSSDGSYQLIASEFVDFEVGEEEANNSETIHVEVFFEGYDIADSEIDGPYYVEVSIGEWASMGDIAWDFYETDPYLASDFSGDLLPIQPPSVSPGSGSYSSVQLVTLSPQTPGSAIFYSIDGSNPNQIYDGPITIDNNKTLKVQAYKKERSSAIDTYTYTINLDTVSTPYANPAGGSFQSIQYVYLYCATLGSSLYYTLDGTTPTILGTPYVPGTAIMIDSSKTLKAIAVKTGMISSNALQETYTINLPKVATPVASPVAGSYNSPQYINLTCATLGAEIRYTVNGSEPTEFSSLYAGTINVSSSTTIKAKAFKAGVIASETASFSYIISLSATKTINCTPNKEYSIPFVVRGLDNVADKTFKLTYDTNKLEVVDLAAQTNSLKTGIGQVKGTDVEILSHNNGVITFKVDKSL
ncbi:MAG: chitobiase/beta-hexosaminidase C-terminal domain-containing protein, partial [Clostridiales bacterium]|nr:chitobiase/beta-hexosaminidase C-terminal domain-containing protein [Clostridiales bacterium]